MPRARKPPKRRCSPIRCPECGKEYDDGRMVGDADRCARCARKRAAEVHGDPPNTKPSEGCK